jgi:2-polyprenyl-6-methoxyphenol hydroxylase-like FAD-dependent oxidoreductase
VVKKKMRVLVVGGGIGGLAAALALRQAGIDVAVFERAGAYREVGAGLTLWPNALHALQALGLRSQLDALAVPQLSGGIRTWRGDVLLQTSIDEVKRRFGAPPVAVHRAELLAMLNDALEPTMVQLNSPLTRFTQDDHGVVATFADGRTERADVLIGADGLHSVVRAQLFGRSKPRYAGYSAWRAVVPYDTHRLPAGMIGETWGCGARFGIVPMSGNRVYWFGTINAPEGQRNGMGGHKREVMELFGGWHAPIRDLVSATDDAVILRNDIYDRPPLRHWTVGRITLLGDAAHPMTPNLGQGACQAIEDAVVLARCLRAGMNPAAGLRMYERARFKRTSAIVQQSRQIGQVGQWSHVAACRARDALMRMTPSIVQMRQLAWILNYQA